MNDQFTKDSISNEQFSAFTKFMNFKKKAIYGVCSRLYMMGGGECKNYEIFKADDKFPSCLHSIKGIVNSSKLQMILFSRECLMSRKHVP